MGMPGRHWPRRVLVVAMRFFDEAVSGRAQVSEMKGKDMAGQAGVER